MIAMELHTQTLNRFCNQYKIIQHYIGDLPSQAIHSRLIHDKLSIHETIAYLCRYQYIFMGRLKAIIKEINPFFEVYKPENDPEYQFTLARSTGALLHEIYRVRDDMKLMLKTISPEGYSRMGTHAVLGRMNICQWLEFFLLHESKHFYTIFKLSGSFWSNESSHMGNVISMPLNQMDELAG